MPLLPSAPARQEQSALPENTSRWEAVLERLEEGVDAAVRAMEDPHAAPRIELWSPPDDLGPLPAGLADRVRRLTEAQKLLLEKMAQRRDETGKQLEALRRVPGIGQPGRSLYLDVSG